MYRLEYLPKAKEDIDKLALWISEEKGMPLTAARYLEGLAKAINNLTKYPNVNPIRYHRFLFQYGFNMRRANYKKMAILYSIHNEVVYIHRVIASSMITGF